MKTKLLALFLVLLAGAPSPALSATFDYFANFFWFGNQVTGDIQTNCGGANTTCVLSASNITGYNLTINGSLDLNVANSIMTLSGNDLLTLNTQLLFNAVKGGSPSSFVIDNSSSGVKLDWEYQGGTNNSFTLCTSSMTCFSAEIGDLTTHNNAPFVIASNPAFASVVPIPTTLPLFASGLGALGLLGWRRKRKAAAT